MRNSLLIERDQIMWERGSTERRAKQAVKASMSRFKIALVALLPGLWLLAGQSLIEPSLDCAVGGVLDSNHALDGSKFSHTYPPFSSDVSTRVIHSRSGKISGKTSSLPFEFLSGVQTATAFSAAPSILFHNPPELASSWQFACRAAPEPRAPTSLS
jgi:hypothetical protein